MRAKATSNWLAMHARFRPGASALREVGLAGEPGVSWTYAEAHLRSLLWAGRLHREGVGPGDRVAVLAHNTIETFALMFACAELGATLMPLNWRLTAVELQDQLQRTCPKVTLADAAHAKVLDPVLAALGLPEVLSLHAGPEAAAHEGPGSALDAPWVLLFTSGSTGRPKGALLTHGQLHWNAVNTVHACALSAADSTLTFTPLFHTGGLNCLSSPLLFVGGSVTVAPGFESGGALRVIAEAGITTLMGVPTIFQMLADHPDFAHTDLSSVRDALCGGAPLSVPLLKTFLARGIPLRQGFGLTEVGPNCFSMPAHASERKAGSVGLPIHHVHARLVRPDGQDCQDDEPGELLLGGPAVFGGYLGADPASDWFATGDVLSRDGEGFFWVRGRLKEMFISGGENVYPAEVEAALMACSGVSEAAVIGVADARWGEVGVAFLTGDGTTEDLQRDIITRLAKFKVPKRYVWLETLPRTASGKIDKPALARSLSPGVS